MKTKQKVEKQEQFEISEKNYKYLKAIMIIFDILALVILIIQLKFSEVTYSSYVVLILCNILIFILRPKKPKN